MQSPWPHPDDEMIRLVVELPADLTSLSLGVDELPESVQLHAREASNGRCFTIGSTKAYRDGYAFEYRPTSLPGMYTSQTVPNTARAGERMVLEYYSGYWYASCGRTRTRQRLFRTDIHDLWAPDQWIHWEINEAASREKNELDEERWGGRVWCQTRWVPSRTIAG